MSTGVVTAITTDWRGDTLAADTTAINVLLVVESLLDFDPDGGWLVVGDSEPLEYTGVDEGTSTVLLAGVTGAIYETGLPVIIWDPTVTNGGAQVVEYVATVELHDGTGSPDAVIPHGLIPASSVDLLIGASVRIEQGADGEWLVDRVLAREATLGDIDIVGARFLTAYEGKRVVVTTEFGGAVLLYTGSTYEDPPDPDADYLGGAGYITSTETDFGGGLAVLQTAIAGPTMEGGPAAPTIGLSTTVNGGVYETAATITADKLNLNGDRIEADNMYLTDPPSGAFTENVNINAVNGQLREVTSSKRFKSDITPATLDPKTLLKIQPVTFLDNGELEADPENAPRHLGVIAEQLHDLGLTEFVTYDADGETPRGVAYSRLSVACLALLQDQESRLADLEAAVKKLKPKKGD